LKDGFNASRPDQDAKNPQLVARVTDPELPKLLNAIYKLPAPATPRNDLVEIFLTGITTKAGGPIQADLNSQLNNVDVDPGKFQAAEELRLNLGVPQASVPNRLGVLAGDLQGYPNGRRLTDDVVDIAVQAVAGAAQTGKLVDALAAGDKVDANDNTFGQTFPFVALPNTSLPTGTQGTQPPASLAPKAATARETSNMVAVVSASVAGLLGVLFFIGWWRRRHPSSGS
jgi:hypothetical protein